MPDIWTGNYQPLRIVARMASSIVMLPHDGLPLDGLLEYAAFQLGWPDVLQHERITENGRKLLPRLTSADPANFVLPIKRHGHKTDPDWYWCASWAEFPEGFSQDRTHWNRRFDGGDAGLSQYLNFGGRSEKVSVKSGRYKGYHMPMCLIVAPVVQWWCVGAADGIAKLLRTITHLGKKRSQGNGECVRWEIWPAAYDWSCWRDGQPMRALPDCDGDFQRASQGIRPPYWHTSRRRLCVLPPTRIMSQPCHS